MSELDTLTELTRDTNKTVKDMSIQLGAIEERCKSHARDIEGLRKSCYGEDGKSGFAGDIRDLQNCKKVISDTRSFWSVVLSNVITSGIIGIILFMLVMWKIHSPAGPETQNHQTTTNNSEK